EAERLDPRSVSSKRRLGFGFLALHRYAEAEDALDRGLALQPRNFTLLLYRALTALSQGELDAARARLGSLAGDPAEPALVAFAANWDLVWALSAEQRATLRTLPEAAFDGDRGLWALSLAQAAALAGDADAERRFGELAVDAVTAQLSTAPGDPRRQVALGLA